MLDFVFLVITTVFFMLLLAAILSTIFRKQIVFDQRANAYLGKSNDQLDKLDKGKHKKKRQSVIVRKYWNQGVNQVSKRMSQNESKKLQVLIRDAGYMTKLSPIEFRLIQLLLAVGGATLVGLLFLPTADNLMVIWLMIITVAFLGYRIPIFYLGKKKTERVKSINRAMPDFFDSVNLLIEAGIGLDGAIHNVCGRMNGPLPEEFRMAMDDVKRGMSRREAFYELRKRVASDAFQSVLTSLIQADQLGVGMAKVLRNLTVRIREQQREKAREQAMKAPIKMLFPMVFFIFPSLFIVILGPLVIMLITEGLGGM
ncbi:hypothetical protein GH741_16795 [Aquibacillus halophilus]|uniref:Type II secretion system protein GspF domain-containing protein n=1 Tax=Aquibacillus halophilus TaxID=930132 RepID=A0A6A8DF72_9BACI|nr:type II secretion system F family protein [Aquibacillus halophilus]MRH44303.1 hypothetical protein [Aquibacillus halophilus]